MSSGGLKCERGACTGDVVENDKEVDESAAKETEEKGQFIQQTKRLTGLLNDVANLSADAIHPLVREAPAACTRLLKMLAVGAPIMGDWPC